jgi:Fungal specific transcription factor domain
MLAFSFWVGVHPLHPLVHAPTFRAAYDGFWQWCQTNDGQVPNQKLVEDPTFLCLMFAVLYSGAVAASSSFWASSALQDFNRETTVGQLSAMLSSSLLLCQHAKHPTFHTLVASLLGFGCSTQVAEPLEELTFLSTTVRIAQSMGLHREATLSKLDVATAELHRRVWWHIVWLDVRLSIEHGSQTCCGTAGANFDTKIVVDSCDETVTRSSPDLNPSLPPPTPSVRSTLIPLAIGRFETARFENMLITHLHRTHQLTLSDFGYFMGLVQHLHSKLDTLIARLPGTALAGKGTIPSRLANASPLTHEKLYGHSSSEPTVFGAWVKIMLSLLKSEALILLKRCLLGHASVDTEQSHGSWNR